jgi:ABC-type nitrate/sulfonate/bicarbonate transport system substrate-binding protein
VNLFKKFSYAGTVICVVAVSLVAFISCGHAASSPTRVTVHVPSKSLAIMPYYFGKDKGFFSPELIEPQLVVMSPPIAIAALVAGELDFATTLGAATSAILRGLPLKRVFLCPTGPQPCSACAARDQVGSRSSRTNNQLFRSLRTYRL